MKTIKIEKEVTKENVYVMARTPDELTEVERTLAKTDLHYVGSEFSDSSCVVIHGGMWFKQTSIDRHRIEITIPQLAELLGVEYPLKPKFEAGKWYHYNRCLLCYVRHDNSIIRAYGVDLSNGEWWDENQFGRSDEKWTPASDAEVASALIAEARKRGFKAGVEINNGVLGFRDLWKKIDGNELVWDGVYLDFGNRGTAIFTAGKWAEVREEEKKLPTLEELIAEAKSKITVRPETYPCWVEGMREIKAYHIGGIRYPSEKSAIAAYISKKIREEYL